MISVPGPNNLRFVCLVNEKLNCRISHCSGEHLFKSIILRWTGHVARREEGRSVFIILTGKPTGNDRLIGLVVSMFDY